MRGRGKMSRAAVAAAFGVAIAPTPAPADPPAPADGADGEYLALVVDLTSGRLTPKPRPRTKLKRGRTQGTKDGMNKLETAFRDEILIPRRDAGEIGEFIYEGLKFRLGKRTFYTPDFVSFEVSGDVVLYEVKGFWEEDARVKVKVAAYLYPFRFVAVTRGKKGGDRWVYEDFSGEDK